MSDGGIYGGERRVVECLWMIVGYPLVLYLVYGLLGAFWVRSPLLNEHIYVSSLWVVRRIATPPRDP